LFIDNDKHKVGIKQNSMPIFAILRFYPRGGVRRALVLLSNPFVSLRLLTTVSGAGRGPLAWRSTFLGPHQVMLSLKLNKCLQSVYLR